MNQRKINAIRSLAERPGTEAEGLAAREALKRLKIPERRNSGERSVNWLFPERYTCACGSRYPFGGKCQETSKHEAIRAEARKRFPRGTRVYYNRWCYSRNAPGTITGYPVMPFSGDWHWVRVKFDDLKSARSIPVRSERGWHLFTEPVSREEFERLYRP